jgi:type II secretory pathway component GspD/PulD (secretin)
MIFLRRAVFFFAFLSATMLLGIAVSRAQDATDPARLIHPDVADQLGLDDAQRAKIQALLLKRLEAKNAATPEKPADFTAIDQQIRETLTPEQLKAWTESPPEQKLRFQFREQSWSDVLQWFARQDNLTLVMDRAPPGTFTYSDNRSYTPTEAIDLLNSVLLTKNFTLLRRDRMLTVIELTADIPIELLPRIKLEELPSRGSFELVSVLFPLGKRPVDAVTKEVQPYLSSYGRAVPLPQSKQLLVIETAGKMQTINLLIASVPEPPPPQAPPPPPPPPPVPVFAAYPLGNLDPNATLATIKTLIPSEQITVDDKTRVLSAFLIPTQQTAIQTAITQMQKDLPAVPPMESMSYKVTDIDFEAIEKQIKAIAPSALVSFDETNNKVLATASAEDQERIGKLLEAVGTKVTEAGMEVRGFKLATGQTTPVSTSLKLMLPNAQILANDTTGTVVVRGSASDLKLAEEIITTYQKTPTDNLSQLKVFPLERTAPTSWLTQISKAFPDSTLWLATDQKQLLIYGSAEEQTRLESMLPELKKLLPPDDSRVVKIYTLSKSQQSRWPLVTNAATAMVPEATLSPLTTGNELVAWANENDHQKISSLLEQLERDATDGGAIRWPKVYPLSMEQPSLVAELIQQQHPNAKVVLSDTKKELTIWADQPTQTAVAALVEQLAAEMPASLPNELRTYSVNGMTPTALQTMLTDLLGTAKAIPDTAGGRLLVWATAATHKQIDQAMEQIQQLPSSDQQKVLVAYTLEHADATNVKALLAGVFPDATIVVDATSQQLVATAPLQEQVKIKATIQQLDIPRAALDAKEIRTYDMKGGLLASTLVTTLQTMWPKLTMTADSTNNQLLVTGSVKEHQQLQAALDRLFSSTGSEELEVQTYTVPFGDLTTLPSILLQLAPKALISTDATNRAIVAWATATQHQKIKQAIDQLSQTAEGRQELQVYAVPVNRSATIRLALVATFPTASIGIDSTSGQIIVLGPKELQTKVAEAIKQLLTAADASSTRIAKKYELAKKIRSSFPSLAVTAIPTVTVATPASDLISPLVILATPQEHQQLEQLAQSLADATGTDGQALDIRVYSLGSIDPTAFQSLLSDVRPSAKIIPGTSTARLMIADSPEGHTAIEKLRTSLEESYKASTGLNLKVYTIRPDLVTQITTMSATLAPLARLFPNTTNDRLTVIATAEDHDKFTTWLKELDSQTMPVGQTLQSYKIRKDIATTFTTLLATRVPNAKSVPSGNPTSLLISASDVDHQTIAALLKELEEKSMAPDQATVRIYPLGAIEKTAAIEILTGTLGTDIKIITTTRTSELAVLASSSEHDQVTETLKVLSDSLAKETGRKLQLFPLDPNQADATSVATTLRASVSASTVLTPLLASNTLMAVGSEEELAKVKQILSSLESELPASQKKQSLVYSLKFADPTAAVRVLTTLVPKATLAADTLGRKIAATATPSEQTQIAEFVKSYDQPMVNERETRMYPLERGSGRGLSFVLTEMIPSATIYGSRDAPVLMATATPEDHEKIATLVKEYNESSGGKTTSIVLNLKKAKASSAAEAISQIDDLIKVTPDIASNSVVVTASAERIAQVEALVKQLEANDGGVLVTKGYKLKGADPLAMQRALIVSFPKATLAADTVNGDLYVTATEAEHVEMQKLIDTSNQAPPRQSLVYALKFADPTAAVRVLQSLLPKATLAADILGKKIAATATADEQTQIAEFVKAYDEPLSTQRETRIYQLKRGSGRGFSFVLTEMLPEATIYGSRETPVVMATATAEDHEKIKAMIDQYNSASGGEEKTIVITLKKASAEIAADAIEQIDDEIRATFDEESNSLIVTATSEKIAQVEAMVKQLDENSGATTTTKSYSLANNDVTALQKALTRSFPKATLAADIANARLYVTATEAEHTDIKSLIESIAPQAARSTKVFNLSKAKAAAVSEAIENLGPEVLVTPDITSNSVIVSAPEESMQRVTEMVQQVEGTSGKSPLTKGYPLKNADPTSLQRALTVSFPRATIAADEDNGDLYITATEEEHQEIQKLIDATNMAAGRKPALRTFKLQHSSPTEVATALQQAFGRRSSAGVSFDENTRTVFVVASNDDLSVAEQVIQQIDVAKGPGVERRLKVFSFGGADGDAIVESVRALFPDAVPPVNASWDVLKEQLVVIGTTDQLKVVEETLQQFQPPDRQLEIFPLQTMDPNTVQTVINSLYSDEPYATSPTVSKDEANSQVLVRGTAEQLKDIRALLDKMGETSQSTPKLRGRVRNVAIERDSELMLQQLQKVWPQLRNNPLEIIRLPSKEQPQAPANPPQPANQSPVIPTKDGEKPPRGPNPDPPQDNLGNSDQNVSSGTEEIPSLATTQETTPTTTPAIESTGTQIEEKQSVPSTLAAPAKSPPIVVIPGDRQWTVASEDTDALDQFEALIAAGMRQPVLPAATTGNYSVYMLRHADAEELEQLFTQLFRRGTGGTSSGFSSSPLSRTTLVADTRINALVVHGGNADRLVVEELLSVLDSDDLVNQLQLELPTLISVENTDAERVLEILQDVYRSQLTSDGGRKPLTIPEGISTDVATILQQINAETTGPLLTLSSDSTSNSIVLRAPAELSKEIADFISLIDERAASQRSRQIQVIKLRESKSDQIEDALRMLLRAPK